MKSCLGSGITALLLSLAMPAFAATTHYVDVNSTNATPPFLDWSTAAANIQSAVDVAAAGDEIVVADGVYSVGGRKMVDTTTNRVAVTKALAIRSLNGPELTVIQGYQVPVSTNGASAIRCAFLTNGASLTGFTLTGGATQNSEYGGGVRCLSTTAAISNCVVTGNWAGQYGGGVYFGTLNNCSLVGNWSGQQGGGAHSAALNNCVLSNNTANLSGGGGTAMSTLINCSLNSNSADSGGGTYYGTASNCTFNGNSARLGGGAYFGTLDFCVLTNNVAFTSGGGADFATLNNCTLIGNSATNIAYSVGGGALNSTLKNCLLARNYAGYQGGGAFSGTLNNCTVASNSAAYGGGAYSSGLSNCIVYYNAATIGVNYFPNATLKNCCTIPKPNSGDGNITNSPAFVDLVAGDFRLQSTSPCVNAGNNAFAPSGTDLDGNPRIVNGTVDIGAYEFQGSGSLMSYAWLQQYGLPTDGSADALDPDADGMENWKEWRCLTDPTNALSVLKLLAPTGDGSGVTVSWQSVTNRSYWLERAANLAAPLTFSSVASNLPGQMGTTTFTDTNAVGPGPFFYRVGVQN